MSGYRGRGLHGEIVERLGRRILAGELDEGETLEMTRLEGELDVSRSVMREALRVLKAKGLVDARQKRGTFVQPRTEWKLLDSDVIRWQLEGDSGDKLLDDLAEFREVVEPASAGLAALRRTDDDLTAIETALESMSAAAAGEGDPVEADLAFHRAILAATHNELLIRTEAVLEAGLGLRDRLVHEAIPDIDSTPAHADLLEAIREGDSERAVEAAKALLTTAVVDLDRARGKKKQPTRRKRK
jgi:GntR family galactonate operon transcriptional repressor